MRTLSATALAVALTLTLSLLPAQPPGPGRGQPWKLHVIDDGSRGADGARLMDINGDGLPDVTCGFEEGGEVRVSLHPGRDKVREKWPSVTVGKVGSPEDAVFVDLDNDGAVDVVSCCEGKTNQVFVHWAPKDRSKLLDPKAWQTDSFPAVKGMTQWMFCDPAQLDARHGVDLVVGGKNKNGQVGWLRSPPDNPRDLSKWQYHFLCNAGWIMTLQATDITPDGQPDILISDRRGKQSGCLWLENPGGGEDLTRPWPVRRFGPQGEQVMFLDFVDLDRDGLQDVLIPTHGRKLYLHRRTNLVPAAWETTQIDFPENTGSGKAVRVADVDLDGKLDIVLACADAQKGSGVVWLSYRQTPLDTTWDVHELSGPPGIKFDLNQLIDLDGDGDLDVINTDEREGGRGLGVVWYENPTK